MVEAAKWTTIYNQVGIIMVQMGIIQGITLMTPTWVITKMLIITTLSLIRIVLGQGKICLSTIQGQGWIRWWGVQTSSTIIPCLPKLILVMAHQWKLWTGCHHWLITKGRRTEVWPTTWGLQSIILNSITRAKAAKTWHQTCRHTVLETVLPISRWTRITTRKALLLKWLCNPW